MRGLQVLQARHGMCSQACRCCKHASQKHVYHMHPYHVDPGLKHQWNVPLWHMLPWPCLIEVQQTRTCTHMHIWHMVMGAHMRMVPPPTPPGASLTLTQILTQTLIQPQQHSGCWGLDANSIQFFLPIRLRGTTRGVLRCYIQLEAVLDSVPAVTS